MKDLDITSLRLFLAVYEARSITRVAESENMVPSAITKRLASLEKDMGTPLLTRVHRGMEPTAAGHLLAEKGRAILSSTQSLREEMDTFQGRLAGMVTLMCTYSMAGGKMLDDVQEFLTYPDHARVRIRIQQQGRWGVAQAIREGRSSLGVLWNLADTAGLQTFPYLRDQIGAVVHRSHPLAGRASVSYDEAAKFETVRIYTARATEAMLERTGGITRAARHNRVEVPSFEVALRLVSGGQYLAFVPLEMARLHAASLNIAAIPLTDTWANRHNVIACRDEASLAPCAQALLRHLIAAAARSADSDDAPVPDPVLGSK